MCATCAVAAAGSGIGAPVAAATLGGYIIYKRF